MTEMQEDIVIISDLIKFLYDSRSYDFVEYAFLSNIILKYYDDFQKSLIQSVGNNSYIESCNEKGIITLIINDLMFKLTPNEGEIEPIINMRVHCFQRIVDL